jgi:hypothetical protein
VTINLTTCHPFFAFSRSDPSRVLGAQSAVASCCTVRHAAKTSRSAHSNRSCGHTSCKCNINLTARLTNCLRLQPTLLAPVGLVVLTVRKLSVPKPPVRRFGWSCRLCRTTVRMFEYESQQFHRVRRSQKRRSVQAAYVVPTTRLSSTFPNRVSPRKGKRWKERSPLGALFPLNLDHHPSCGCRECLTSCDSTDNDWTHMGTGHLWDWSPIGLFTYGIGHIWDWLPIELVTNGEWSLL